MSRMLHAASCLRVSSARLHLLFNKPVCIRQDTPLNPSFMHLHLGLDAAGLEPPELHHIVVPSWERGVDAEQVHRPPCACMPARSHLDCAFPRSPLHRKTEV